LFRQLKEVFDLLPWNKVPDLAKDPLMQIKTQIDIFLKQYPKRLLSNLHIEKVSFPGLKNRALIRDLTDQELKSLFAKGGLREAHNGHIYQRLKQRGAEFGLSTPDNVASAINYGTRRAGKNPGTVEILLPNGRGYFVVNGKGELITITFE
jgi:hypothetical protein